LVNRLKDIPEKKIWNYSSFGKINQQKLSKYKNLHKGKRCFLIANGPSLNKMDLSCLKNEITFGMNRIYMIYDKLEFVPSYHFVSNELVHEQFAEDLQNVKSEKFYNWKENYSKKKTH
tara:strand:- start:50 stop:403 length:354 start_codon:yes stop_codon:yes gene_type:complete